MKGMKNKLKQ